MRYYEITEKVIDGSHAYLYHATTFDRAEAILKDNKLEARTVQLVDARRGKRRLLKRDEWSNRPIYVYDMKGGRLAKGVSLTRDYEFAESWKNSEVIFVFDQPKLLHRFKIVPVDHTNNSRYDYSSPGVDFSKEWMEQAEEFVIGDIAPISRFLLSINISLRHLDGVTLWDREDHAIILQNPLLNKVVPRSHLTQYDRQAHLKAYAFGDDEHNGYYNNIRPAWKS